MSIVTYGLLLIAIVFEALGTSFLEKSDKLSHLFPAAVSLCFYAASFVLGAYILDRMPMGIMYTVWCGAGIVLVGVVGYVMNRQTLDTAALVGMAFVACGVAIIYLFSRSVSS